MKILKPTPDAIAEAAQQLRAGELVAFPTETVYGLGADASSVQALRKLYAAKGRPPDHPVIVHLHDIEQLCDWAARVPGGARRLAEALWPGPLTLILPKAPAVPAAVTGGQETVGIRMPSHPVARLLLKEFGGGVAAPSANKFGRISATSPQDVAEEFSDEPGVILDGGRSDVGIESTIVDFSGEHPRIVRPGMITAEQVEAIVERPLHAGVHGTTRAPGTLPSHYAPRTPCRLVPSDNLRDTVLQMCQSGTKVCVLSFQESADKVVPWIVASSEPARYAHELYRSLRKLDREGADVIIIETVPAANEWAGIADRLKRASSESNGRV